MFHVTWNWSFCGTYYAQNIEQLLIITSNIPEINALALIVSKIIELISNLASTQFDCLVSFMILLTSG